jgi:integrase/recombinase XerD
MVFTACNYNTMNVDLNDFISYITIKKGLSKNTVRHFTCRFRVIQRYHLAQQEELNRESVEKFLYGLKTLGRSNACLNTYILTYQHIERYLNDRGEDIHFMDTLKVLPKRKADIQILSLDEINRILSVELTYGLKNGINPTDYLNLLHNTFIMALAFTGARFSEMAMLQVKYFDETNGKATFVDTKNGETRRVDLALPLIERMKLLAYGKKQDEYIFTNTQGHTLHSTDFANDLRKRAKLAGISSKRVYPHLLRHSFATHLLMYGANVDISMVATILGHKDIQTTYDTYLHLADDTIRKVHFSHPLIRKSNEPADIIKNVAESIDKFKLDTDDRLGYHCNQSNNSYTFTVYVK